jgi:hypothetical protein
MANTRFNYDYCRTVLKLEQQTGPGRWILNVPGNGSEPGYIEDPSVLIQGWGANLRTNGLEIENDLLGLTRRLNRDNIQKNNYATFQPQSRPLSYKTNTQLTTEQSRTIAPAWMYRDLEQVDWYYPPLNPQENTCMPFEANLSTRILEKDYFVPKIPSITTNFSN